MQGTKTNAMRLLDRLSIAYEALSYDAADGAIDGLAVAQKTGHAPQDVYKTLVGCGASGAVHVFCIPVDMELELKRAARAAGEKSFALLPLAQLLPTTGYQRGGVSPLAMKKPYPVHLWAGALQRPYILVSGGKVGLQICLAPARLVQAAGATLFE